METRALLTRLRERAFALHGRQAKAATIRFNLIKTLGQTLVMWAVFLAIGPLIAVATEERFSLPRFDCPFWLAALFFVAGWILAWTSAYFMVSRGDGTPLPVDSTRRLVVVGPYRWLRNPMALGSIGQGFAVGLALGSPLTLLYAFCGALMWNFSARSWEEHDLETKFGDEFRAYRSAVKCWLPRWKPYSSR